MPVVWVEGPFDNLQSGQVRFLAAAAKHGPLHVWLWPDERIQKVTGQAPRFPAAERAYLLESLRMVTAVEMSGEDDAGAFPTAAEGDFWALPEADATPETGALAREMGLHLLPITAADLPSFLPLPRPDLSVFTPCRPRVIVTGCYDWLHSGHVRFFEEASSYGELIVTVGNDVTVRSLKGEGHPLQPQEERRFMVGAVRFVHQALVSTGGGWLDAVPEIDALRPQIYVVNDDGDRPEKLAFCLERGMDYLVLRRLPRPGLEARSSTRLRGF